MPGPDMSAIVQQVTSLERRQDTTEKDVERHDRQLAVHEEQISGATGLVKAMERLGSKVDSLNKALWGFAVSFMVAAITIAVTIASNH